MRYFPTNNTTAELVRIFNLIQKDIENGTTNATTTIKSGIGVSGSGSGGGGGSVSSGPAGPAGVDGTDGATGDPGLALVGARNEREILMDFDGSVLTDEHGYALVGVNTENEVLCGVTDNVISPLAGV